MDQARRQRYSVRYGARDPFLAGWPRAATYLIWRAAVSLSRPVLFTALVVLALVFALRAQPLEAAGRAEPPSPEAIAETRLGDPLAWWRDALESSLRPGLGRAPDLPLAQSLSGALTPIVGREALARRVLAETGHSHRRIEADLRAMPGWRRDAHLDAVLEAHWNAGGLAANAPRDLVFAPTDTAGRLARAQALYGPALEAVGAWFDDPDGRTLALRAVPGLSQAPARAALHGDVRDVLVQSCALAESAGRRIGQCRVVFLPKPGGDVLTAGLALTVAGAEGRARVGARVLKAAGAAGLLRSDALTRLVLGADLSEAEDHVLAVSADLVSDAGERFTRPVYSVDETRAAARAFERAARIDTAARDAVLQDVARVRRASGALAAVRTAHLIDGPEDAARLAAVAERHEGALLALEAALGRDLLRLADEGAPTLSRAGEVRIGADAVVALVAGGLATALLLWVLIAGYNRRRGGAPGAFERVDAAATRLILGRNS